MRPSCGCEFFGMFEPGDSYDATLLGAPFEFEFYQDMRTASRPGVIFNVNGEEVFLDVLGTSQDINGYNIAAYDLGEYVGMCIKGLCGGYLAYCADDSQCVSGVCDPNGHVCSMPSPATECMDYSSNYFTNGAVTSYVSIDDELMAYFGDENGGFYSVDLNKGVGLFNMKNLRLSSPLLRWKFVDIGASEVGAVKTPPYVDYDSSLVYYGTDKGWLYVLDVTDGSKVASLDVTGSRDVGLLGSYNGILNYNGNLYMTDTAGFLHVVSKISGISRQATLNENSVKIKDNRMISSPVLDDVNNLLYIGTEDGEIYKVSINSQGTMSDPVSVYHADGEIFIGTPYIDDNYLYFAGCQKLYKFDKRTFSLSDSVDLDLSVQSKCVSSALSKVNGLILVAANDGVLYAYSADTLSLYWKFTPSQGVLANRLNLNLEPMRSMPVEAVNVDGMVFVGNDNGRAYSVDLKLGEALGEHIVRGDVHTLNSFEFMGSSKVIFGAETGIYVMDVENCMATDDICTSDVHCNVGEICLNGACEDVTYEVTGFGESCVRDSLGVAVDINNYDSILSGINSGEYTINDDYCNEGLLCNINTFECDAPSGCAQDCTSLGMYCSSMISGICGGEGASCMSTEISSPDGLDETHMPLDSMCTTGFTCNHESGVCVSVCENGVQDTGELGIDCGGTCTLECGELLCENGVQDTGELGIDCGGTCTLCPGTCLVDLDCDQGELCYTNVCVRGCSGDNDCQSGEDCTNGICLPTISLTAGDSCLRSIETQSMIDLPSADNVEGWQALYDGIGTGIFELSVCDTGLICDPMGLLCVEQVLGLGLPCADGLGPGNECTDNDGVKVGHCNSDLICGGENAMCYPDQNKLCANGLICDPVLETCIQQEVEVC